MGVPAYFRWLSSKYPKIIVDAEEEEWLEGLGEGKQRPDAAGPNPNGLEFDNLYLDMNGIIHPCSHPENQPQPESEQEILQNIFNYIDRLFCIVRPRKLLFMAIDGVAPRAKMNQQRSRRFRAARDFWLKQETDKLKAMSEAPPWHQITPEASSREDGPAEAFIFDSNVITPGTAFMDSVAKAVKLYALHRLSSDSGWRGIQVLISDAGVPGEGEHKIMEFIRSQRGQAAYDPNTKHVLYGLDADLIMLSLATHEPHFTILRETVIFRRSDPAIVKDRPIQAPFQFLKINVLREYLGAQLLVDGLGFAWDLERVIDDYVFMCFFVGNDFLPHMPTLEIREHSIDLLIGIYKQILPSLGGYLTTNGEINLANVEVLVRRLGTFENSILQKRLEKDTNRMAAQIRNRADGDQHRRDTLLQYGHAHHGGVTARFRAVKGFQETRAASQDPVAVAATTAATNEENRRQAFLMRKGFLDAAAKERIVVDSAMPARPEDDDDALDKADATAILALERTQPETTAPEKPEHRPLDTPSSPKKAKSPTEDGRPAPAKRTKNVPALFLPSEPRPPPSSRTTGGPEAAALQPAKPTPPSFRHIVQPRPEGTAAYRRGAPAMLDPVCLGAPGWRERYYAMKLNIAPDDCQGLRAVVRSYVEGLAWVMRYYYHGCCSWTWYYPYYYAPFAGDLTDLAALGPIQLPLGRPFTPFEQLMAVLPASSRACLPQPYHALMTDAASPILDFYPETFEIDMNGKLHEWQGVALIRFIDEGRLLAALKTVEGDLNEEERRRNAQGSMLLAANAAHEIGRHVERLSDDGALQLPERPSEMTSPGQSIFGTARRYAQAAPLDRVLPTHDGAFAELKNAAVICRYAFPTYPEGHIFGTQLLPDARPPRPTLTSEELASARRTKPLPSINDETAPPAHHRRQHDGASQRPSGHGGPATYDRGNQHPYASAAGHPRDMGPPYRRHHHAHHGYAAGQAQPTSGGAQRVAADYRRRQPTAPGPTSNTAVPYGGSTFQNAPAAGAIYYNGGLYAAPRPQTMAAAAGAGAWGGGHHRSPPPPPFDNPPPGRGAEAMPRHAVAPSYYYGAAAAAPQPSYMPPPYLDPMPDATQHWHATAAGLQGGHPPQQLLYQQPPPPQLPMYMLDPGHPAYLHAGLRRAASLGMPAHAPPYHHHVMPPATALYATPAASMQRGGPRPAPAPQYYNPHAGRSVPPHYGPAGTQPAPLYMPNPADYDRATGMRGGAGKSPSAGGRDSTTALVQALEHQAAAAEAAAANRLNG